MKINKRRKRLLQNHDTLVQWVQHALNAIVVVVSLVLLTTWRDGFVADHYRIMLVLSVLVMWIVYHVFGVHRRFDNVVGAIQHLARAWGFVIIILAWAAFLTKTSEKYSRQVIVYWAVFAFIGQALVQVCVAKFYELYNSRIREKLPALIVGTGSVAHHLARSLKKNIWLPDNIVGCVLLDGEGVEAWKEPSVPVLGGLAELKEILISHGIRRIYLAPTFALPPRGARSP